MTQMSSSAFIKFKLKNISLICISPNGHGTYNSLKINLGTNKMNLNLKLRIHATKFKQEVNLVKLEMFTICFLNAMFLMW